MFSLLILATTEPTTGSLVSDIGLLLLGFLGLVGIIGAVSAYFYKGRADALIKLQKEEINVLQDTNKRLTDQNSHLIKERAEFIAEQKRIRAEIKNLKTLLAQPKQLQQLAKTMSQQHMEVINKLTDIAAGLIDTAGEQNGNSTKSPTTRRRS